ncbi:MAG: ankyrin repeat domain-containing protein [Aquabacterium sp.]
MAAVGIAAATAVSAQDAPAEFGGFSRPPWVSDAGHQLIADTRAGRWPKVLAALKAGAADPRVQDWAGANVLALAARAGQEDVLREMLQRGADLDRPGEDGFTALGAAAFQGHAAIAQRLLRAGADPAALGATGQTALHLAALSGRVGVIDALLRAGVRPDLPNIRGDSAADIALRVHQDAALQRLLQAGARPPQVGVRLW